MRRALLVRLLSLTPDGLLDLRLGELGYVLGREVGFIASVFEVVDVLLAVVDMNVGVVVSFLLDLGARGPPVDCVLPALVEVRVFAADAVVQNRRLLHLLETAS